MPRQIKVYRVGHAHDNIANRNVGDIRGIVVFLNQECEDYKLRYCLPGQFITEYVIEVYEPFGPYQAFIGGRPRGAPVNIETVGRTYGHGGWGTWYSLPAEAEGKKGPGGWRLVRKSRSLPIEQFNEATTQGAEEAAKEIEVAF